MTAKEWLNRRYVLHKRIKSMMAAKEVAFSIATGVKAITSGERVQTSPQNNVEENMLRYTVLSQDLDKKMLEYEKISGEISALICCLENAMFRKILWRRYIEVDTWQGWENYALEIGYSKRQLTRLHKEALQKIEKQLKNQKGTLGKIYK